MLRCWSGQRPNAPSEPHVGNAAPVARQIVEGDLSAKLARYLDPSHPTKVGHLQVAAVPDRGEPDAGELAWGHLFSLIDQLGWPGWVGAEYRPRAGTRAGLGWFQPWRRR